MRKLRLIILIIYSGIASGQSLKPIDTICLSLPEARHLAYYKLNFPKLDSINRLQAQMIDLLNKSLESKRKLLDICYLENENLHKQIDLLKAKHAKELQLYKHKKTFWQKAKPYAIGFVSGIVIYSIAGHPP